MTAEMDPKFIVSRRRTRVLNPDGKNRTILTDAPPLRFQTVHQARCLAQQVQLFYGTQRQETLQLLETFNRRPADFRHMSVIAELEQSGLGAPGAAGGSTDAQELT